MIRQAGGDVAHEPFEAQTRDRRDGVKRQSLRRAEAFELGPALFRAGELRLAARDNLRVGSQVFRIRGELAMDHAPLLYGVTPARRIEVNEMDEHARPLRMAQEAMPQSLAFGRSLDQSGQIGDDEGPMIIDP